MISVRDGQNHILSRITAAVAPELLPVPRAPGRVLAEDLKAPIDVPPADNSAVDGYAVGSADIPPAGARELVVVADLAAGSVFDGVLSAGHALRIMTGAPMPAGADTVYPQEIVDRHGERVRIGSLTRAPLRLRGEDVEAGAIVGAARCCGAGDRPGDIARRLALWCGASPASRSFDRDEVAEPGTRGVPARSTTPIASRCADPSSSAAVT